jgi:polysaccharide biosynthesis/export protein
MLRKNLFVRAAAGAVIAILAGELAVAQAPLVQPPQRPAAAAQDPPTSKPSPQAPGQKPLPTSQQETGVTLPEDYVIGAEDILTIVFWRDKELSAEVIVRPDGMISLPLLNDVPAAGLTPEQLRQALEKAATSFVKDPSAAVMVRAINSRKVFVVGEVGKPGSYPLTGDMNVLQLLAQAGGVLEFADAKNIVIVRKVAGKEQRLKFNYRDVLRGKNTQQNILLKPGDTVIVP